MIRLTDEEISLAESNVLTRTSYGGRHIHSEVLHEVAKAQLKKVVEWLQQYSQPVTGAKMVTSHSTGTADAEARFTHRRIDISATDWQALLEEVKE